MAKKRLIFTLLYNNGSFMLSRNFKLQRVGDVNWLNKNYNFSSIATAIDELIILDVTRGETNTKKFCQDVEKVVAGCFMPLALGGRVRTLDQVNQLLAFGADKTVVNTPLFKDPDFIVSLVEHYGSQFVIASIDYKMIDGHAQVFTCDGTEAVDKSLAEIVTYLTDLGVGEIYLNSIDKDGTGQGYIMQSLEQMGERIKVPVIMAGGAGNFNHLKQGLESSEIDAVATANLFNFVGNGLPSARTKLLEENMPLAHW